MTIFSQDKIQRILDSFSVGTLRSFERLEKEISFKRRTKLSAKTLQSLPSLVQQIDEMYLVTNPNLESEKAFRDEIKRVIPKSNGVITFRRSFDPDVHYVCRLKIDTDYQILEAKYSFWIE